MALLLHDGPSLMLTGCLNARSMRLGEAAGYIDRRYEPPDVAGLALPPE